MLTFDYLANHRGCIPRLAMLAYAQWRPVFDSLGLTLNDVNESFEGRANIDRLPLAIVALADGVVIGTGALKTADLPLRPTLSPWLGGMLVETSHRNNGVGGKLTQRLCDEARRLHLPHLYLWTPASESLYVRHGAMTIERLYYCGYEIALMKLPL